MRYLTYYKEYPIYEPAEGGYYYAGNEVAQSERMSKRKCRSRFNEIWKECEKENIENGFTEDVDWAEIHNEPEFIRGLNMVMIVSVETQITLVMVKVM